MPDSANKVAKSKASTRSSATAAAAAKDGRSDANEEKLKHQNVGTPRSGTENTSNKRQKVGNEPNEKDDDKKVEATEESNVPGNKPDELVNADANHDVSGEKSVARECDESNNEPAPVARGGRQAQLPVYAKRKVNSSIILSPKKLPSAKEFTRAISTLQCRCGTNVMMIQTASGQPTYCNPIIQKANTDPTYARNVWKVDFTGVLRNPDDMDAVKEFPSQTRQRGGANDKKVLQNLLLRFPEDDKEKTLAFREKWGEVMVRTFNSPAVQQNIFGTNKKAYYAGDLTPKNPESKKPYLSDYLTIKHTLDALEVAFGANKNRAEILADDMLLGYYFPRDTLSKVRESEKIRANRESVYATFDDLPAW